MACSNACAGFNLVSLYRYYDSVKDAEGYEIERYQLTDQFKADIQPSNPQINQKEYGIVTGAKTYQMFPTHSVSITDEDKFIIGDNYYKLEAVGDFGIVQNCLISPLRKGFDIYE